MLRLARDLNIPIFSGVYRAFKILGGDAVGISMVPETMLACHCGLKVVSICAIINLGASLDEILSHQGTLRGAKLATEHIVKLFLAFIASLGKD